MEIDTESLKYVYFESSLIESLTEEFVEQLEGIEYLNADGVGLKRVDGEVLGRLKELTIFWGGSNRIKMLEAKAFSRNKKLVAIYLKFNQINFIDPRAFDELEQLYVLDLSSNKLRVVSTIFNSISMLVKLDLSSNLIEKIDSRAFVKLKTLRELNLHNNNLKRLDPDLFAPLLSVEHINISFNKSPLMTITADLFKYNFHLKKVFLINNKIESIDPKFIGNLNPELKVISLRYNSCIDDDMLVESNGTLTAFEKQKLEKCFNRFNAIN